ncbi:hypothetical protein BDW62DRAFT_165103 [Aspergillus aurantiobrunneus]
MVVVLMLLLPPRGAIGHMILRHDGLTVSLMIGRSCRGFCKGTCDWCRGPMSLSAFSLRCAGGRKSSLTVLSIIV